MWRAEASVAKAGSKCLTLLACYLCSLHHSWVPGYLLSFTCQSSTPASGAPGNETSISRLIGHISGPEMAESLLSCFLVPTLNADTSSRASLSE